MIADERAFAKLRKDILDGNLNEANQTLIRFLDLLKVYSEDSIREIGQSFQEFLNFIDEVGKAQSNLTINSRPAQPSETNDSQDKETSSFNGVIANVGGENQRMTMDTMSDAFEAGLLKGTDVKFVVVDGKAFSIDDYNMVLAGALDHQQALDYLASNPNLAKDVKAKDFTGFDTGGFTGYWNGNDGKLAMLHQKEIVLNPNDTKNLLDMVKMTRDFIPNLPKIQLPKFNNPFNTQGVGDTNYNLTLKIDNLNGTRQDANNIATTIMQSLKKMGH